MSNAAYATSPDAVRELDADAVTARLKYVPNAPQDLELAFIARGGSSSRLVPMPGMNIQPEDLVDDAVAIGDVMPVTVGDVVAVGEKKGIAKLLMPGYCACTLARHRRAVASTVQLESADVGLHTHGLRPAHSRQPQHAGFHFSCAECRCCWRRECGAARLRDRLAQTARLAP